MSDTTGPAVRPVDPFGFWPKRSSALIDRPGTEETEDRNYAFHTPYVLQGPSAFEFRARISGLSGDTGSLTLRLLELGPNPGDAAECIGTENVAVDDLRASQGSFTCKGHSREGYRYALLGRLSPDASLRGEGIELSLVGDTQANAYRQRLIESRGTIFSRPPLFAGLYQFVAAEPSLAIPVSQMCTVNQFGETAYDEWCGRLKRTKHLHRKQWEFVYILQSLRYYGALEAGKRGLGFGVGQEPLPALMAAMGCDVLATDLPAEHARASDWSATNQHAEGLEGVRFANLVDQAAFDRHVRFRPVDMTDIPADLTDFDFTWSSCALEHVGSIAKGLDFIENSIRCLKPGGTAVHTTELNLLSDDGTLDHAGTVIFRRRDIEEIAARLILKGHDVKPLNFNSGETPLDDHIDVAPYSSNNHFKLLISQYVTTSVGLIVTKGDRA